MDKVNRLGLVLHQVLTDNDFSFLRKEETLKQIKGVVK